ncbi:MAG TPA: hypothetical protein VE057_07165 [Archangium sp.]|nr:hypothetical protein [Archangium sp.]
MPGLALFYGGMVQGKNVLSTLMHSFGALAVVTVVWALWGYSLAFGESHGGLIGGATHLFMKDVGQEAKGTLPHILFFLFQGTFAAITPALISGAYPERLKFSAFLLFTVLWTTFVYAPRGALGVGSGRLAAEAGRARLRGRRRGAPHQWCVGARGGARGGPPPGRASAPA